MATFRKAKAEQAALKMGVYGPAGSGKTFTSLLVAEGLGKATGKRVAYVDTERGTDFYCKTVPERPVHPEAFDFDALYTKSLTETLAACKSIDLKEYGVVVLDSITHLWEAAIAAYGGKKTRADTIPMHAWGPIKKPYKELMSFLLSSPLHVLFCGRQGNVYETDSETEELTCTGVKMKAEGETPYEPHVLIRMESRRQKTGDAIIQAFIEKDRTGVLQGRIIQNPNFDSICRPMLCLLGGVQARIPSEDETASKDADAIATADSERRTHSEDLRKQFSAELDLCKSADELKGVGKKLSSDVKKQMLPDHVSELREKYLELETKFGGKAA